MNLFKLFAILFVATASIQQVKGQAAELIEKDEERLVTESLDSLWISYLVNKQRSSAEKPTDYDSTQVPTFSDSVYMKRLEEINSIIPLDFNEKTKRYIEVYAIDKREIVPYMLGLADYYFPIFEAALDKYDMPLELRFVPVIESALKPNAVSRSGAVGLWQFMYWTAKYNHLYIDSYVDERRDPRASTEAACQYLSELYGMYNDWQLAIAAYNCGPGNVNKAIRKAGGKKNFWEIYRFLPRETRGYVPAFIAANYIFNYHKEHNIYPKYVEVPHGIDTVMVERKLFLSDVAEELQVDEAYIRALNPQYKKGIVPATVKKPYAIALPIDKCLTFSDNAEKLHNLYDSVTTSRTTTPDYSSTYYSTSNTAGKEKLYYTVKSGDNLGFIADWYDTYVSYIKQWNGLHSNFLKVGQKLVIYVPSDKVNHYTKINHLSTNEKNGATSTSNNQNDFVYYTFKSGDSLWNVIQKYPGNSVTEVMTMNNISNAKGIKPGTVIKLNKNS